MLLQFLSMVSSTLDSRLDYEAGQAYLGLFLKVQADEVMTRPALADALTRVLSKQEEVLQEAEEAIVKSSALVAFYRNAAVN